MTSFRWYIEEILFLSSYIVPVLPEPTSTEEDQPVQGPVEPLEAAAPEETASSDVDAIIERLNTQYAGARLYRSPLERWTNSAWMDEVRKKPPEVVADAFDDIEALVDADTASSRTIMRSSVAAAIMITLLTEGHYTPRNIESDLMDTLWERAMARLMKGLREDITNALTWLSGDGVGSIEGGLPLILEFAYANPANKEMAWRALETENYLGMGANANSVRDKILRMLRVPSPAPGAASA